MINDLKIFISGILIGISNAIPGVSGGTMAVILNVYDRILEAVDIRKFKENIRFLTFLILGAIFGIVGLSKLILPLRENYPIILGFSFIGLILGSLPAVYRNGIKAKGDVRVFHWLLTIFTFILMIGMSILKSKNITSTNVDSGIDLVLLVLLILSGAVAAIAMVIPGISGSLVMLLLGTYDIVIESIGKFQFSVILPTGIGVILGLALGIGGIKKMLSVFPIAIYSIILGLVSGSILAVYPGWKADMEGFIALAICSILAILVYLMSKKENKAMK